MDEKEWHELVGDFLIARGDNIPCDSEQELLDSVKLLRIRLHEEEMTELTIALHEHDRIGTLDAICDTLYVVLGTAVACGFGPVLDKAFREVHRSNMTKDFLPVGSEQKSGKKGDRYEAPNLQQFL
jgi:predicted HAD superfamily Cof-like phosphohydrolase